MALRTRLGRLADNIAAAAMLGLLGLAMATAADVAGRYLFATPIRGFNDIVPLAGAVLLSACMPHVVARRGNIAVDFVGQWLGPAAQRRLDNFGAALCSGFFVLMAWQYALYAIELRQTGDVTPLLRWPVWPWWSAVAVFITVTAVVGLATVGGSAPVDAQADGASSADSPGAEAA
jgi:TRAP-type C4-dicarboxylate transport system permease small subunit